MDTGCHFPEAEAAPELNFILRPVPTRLHDAETILFNCEFLVTASVVYWSEFLATDPEIRVRFPALPDIFLRSTGSGTGSTQPRDDN
jgi:hypothetical protein